MKTVITVSEIGRIESCQLGRAQEFRMPYIGGTGTDYLAYKRNDYEQKGNGSDVRNFLTQPYTVSIAR